MIEINTTALMRNANDPDLGDDEWDTKRNLKRAANALLDLRSLLLEIRGAIAISCYSAPTEEPSQDEPWLPVGLRVKIDQAIEAIQE